MRSRSWRSDSLAARTGSGADCSSSSRLVLVADEIGQFRHGGVGGELGSARRRMVETCGTTSFISVFPILTMSPGTNAASPRSGLPLSIVPLRDSRSRTWKPSEVLFYDAMKPAGQGFLDHQQIGEIPADGQRPAVERDLPLALLLLDFQICVCHRCLALFLSLKYYPAGWVCQMRRVTRIAVSTSIWRIVQKIGTDCYKKLQSPRAGYARGGGIREGYRPACGVRIRPSRWRC